MKHHFVLACLLLLGHSQNLFAEKANWPGWRGQHQDNISTETGLLQDWPEGGPRQVWLYEDCGLGYSGPAVVGDRLYILGSRNEKEQLICLQASDATELWSAEIGQEWENDWGNGPRSTPTVDGEFIYALGGRGDLVCFSLEDGAKVWSKTMQELGGEIPKWGFSESPTIHGNMVLCTPGGEKGAVVALDKISGDLIWQASELTDIAHYSSVVTTEHQGKQVGIQLLESQAVGIDLENGKLLWSSSWPGRVAVIPTPIVWDDKVFVTSGYGVGCMMLQMGDDHSVTPIYDNKVMVNHHGGVIRIGEHLFGHSDSKGWTCQEFESGKRVWREREALGKGAIAYADGRFYCLSEDDGDVVLVAASSDGWEEHGRFRIDPQTKIRSDRGKVWTHPVIAGGRLYLRDQDLLFSFDVKK